MADLGITYGLSGKSLIENASGENNSLTKTTSENNYNIKYDSIDSKTSSVDSVDSDLGITNPDTTTTYFIMRGKDIDCVGVVYRFWTVTGSPDTDASEYAGVKCGATALQDIIVVFKYTQ